MIDGGLSRNSKVRLPPDTKSTSSSSDTADLSKPSVLKFHEPVPNTIGVQLLQIAIKDLLPTFRKIIPMYPLTRFIQIIGI